MTDLEMTKLCADAMGIVVQLIDPEVFRWAREKHYRIPERGEAPNECYDPLHDDAQAMALVKKFNLSILFACGDDWQVCNLHREDGGAPNICTHGLNRAVVSCVAQMQAAQSGAVQKTS